MKILCVDDDPVSLLLLGNLVESLGYESIRVESAEAAIPHLDDLQVSLILCDWEMPGMSGPALCQYVRESNIDRYMYIILVTGRTQKDSLIDGLNAGADDFIRKPVEAAEIRVRLRSAVRVLDFETTLGARNLQLAETNAEIAQAFEHVTADLQLAAEMQYELLPKKKQLDNIVANWMFKPAKFIAGDMFDYFNLTDTLMVFYIVDVEGHGIPSALTSFAVYNLLTPASQGMCMRNVKESSSLEEAVVKTVTTLNKQFTNPEGGNRYFTMIYGILDKVSGEVVLSQAGHPPAIHYSATKKNASAVGVGGFPVGIFDTSVFEPSCCKLEPGDRLFVYSDGITECGSINSSIYGSERLCEKILQWSNEPIETINTVFDEEFTAWNGSVQFGDDVSMVCIEFKPPC